MAIEPALLERPENRILQMCARGTVKHSDFVSILGEVLDWTHLVSQLHFHRLTLFFLHHVAGHEARVPADALEELHNVGDQILHCNLFLLSELQQVTQTLTKQEARVLSYKGPSIAYSAYGTVALRRFVDLDLLISPQTKERTKMLSILRGAGYREMVVRTVLTSYLRHQKVQTDYEVSLQSREGKTFLDLHWAVAAPFESFPLSFEQMWERRVPAGSISGVYTLCREDLIIALCFHGLKHSWEEMEWIGCLLNLIENEREGPLDWHLIEGTVESGGCQRVLYLGLHLANDLLTGSEDKGVEKVVPAHLWRKVIEDITVKRMAQQIWRRILSKDLRKDGNPFAFIGDYALRFSLGMQARPSWHLRRTFFVGMLRIGLLSLERSTTVEKIAQVVSKFFGRTTRTRSS